MLNPMTNPLAARACAFMAGGCLPGVVFAASGMPEAAVAYFTMAAGMAISMKLAMGDGELTPKREKLAKAVGACWIALATWAVFTGRIPGIEPFGG